eukprot:Tbor_TRINITY_DN5236_c3_g1::TRINITY_DN5236_c3_g1_i1::g.16828::m.16828
MGHPQKLVYLLLASDPTVAIPIAAHSYTELREKADNVFSFREQNKKCDIPSHKMSYKRSLQFDLCHKKIYPLSAGCDERQCTSFSSFPFIPIDGPLELERAVAEQIGESNCSQSMPVSPIILYCVEKCEMGILRSTITDNQSSNNIVCQNDYVPYETPSCRRDVSSDRYSDVYLKQLTVKERCEAGNGRHEEQKIKGLADKLIDNNDKNKDVNKIEFPATIKSNYNCNILTYSDLMPFGSFVDLKNFMLATNEKNKKKEEIARAHLDTSYDRKTHEGPYGDTSNAPQLKHVKMVFEIINNDYKTHLDSSSIIRRDSQFQSLIMTAKEKDCPACTPLISWRWTSDSIVISISEAAATPSYRGNDDSNIAVDNVGRVGCIVRTAASHIRNSAPLTEKPTETIPPIDSHYINGTSPEKLLSNEQMDDYITIKILDVLTGSYFHIPLCGTSTHATKPSILSLESFGNLIRKYVPTLGNLEETNDANAFEDNNLGCDKVKIALSNDNNNRVDHILRYPLLFRWDTSRRGLMPIRNYHDVMGVVQLHDLPGAVVEVHSF